MLLLLLILFQLFFFFGWQTVLASCISPPFILTFQREIMRAIQMLQPFLFTVLPMLFWKKRVTDKVIWSDIGGSGSARNPRAKTGNCNEPSKEAGGLCPGTGPKEAIFSFKLVRFYILHNCNQLISNHWYQILKFLVTQFEFLSDSVSAILTS